MSTDLGSAVAKIGLDYSGLVTDIAASKTLLGGLGVGLLGVADVAAGAGIAATQMAGNFQEGLTSLVTGAGEAKSNLGLVSDGMLSLATTTGTSTKELTDGMYMIESAGYHGAAGLDVLKASAEGAKVGSASLADVANGVTTAMTDYSSSNLTASQATNTLIATVAAGKTHMGDLARSFSNILPVASAVHASFYDVSAAMATMTGEGTSAQLASTYLKQILLALEVPSKGAATALASIGLTTKEVAADMQQSLPDTLQLITDKLKEKFPEGSAAYVEAIKAISGGSKNMMAMLELTGSHMDTFKANLASITGAVKAGGDTITGWNLVQDDFNTKVAQAREVVEVLGIKIGTALLPVASKLFDAVTPLLTSFGDWITKSGVLNQLAGDLSSGLNDVEGFVKALTSSAKACTVGFDNTNQIFGDFRTILQSVHDILPDVGAFLGSVGTDVQQNLLPPLESLMTNVAGATANFVHWLDTSGVAKTALQDLSSVVGVTSVAVGTLVGWVADVVGWLGGGGVGTNTLVFALSVVGAAFAGLKIAETVTQFSNLWAKLSDGEGLFVNVADAVRSKLGKALDDFLSNQAPAFKQSLDDFKQKSADAAIAEEDVGTAAETSATKVTIASGTMKGEYEQLSLWADEAGTSTGTIGTGAETSAAEVAAASVEMDTSLGGVTASADAASLSTKGIGAASVAATPSVLSFASALGAVAAVGFSEFSLAKWIKDNGWLPDAPKNGPEWITHQTQQINQSFDTMKQSVVASVTTMSGQVVTSMDEMKVKSYADTSSFTSDAMTMFAKMGDYGSQQMQSLDKNTIGYWNDIAAYIAGHPIDGVMNINMGQGSVYSHLSSGIQKNYFASGVLGAPAGWAVVGENGPELMHLHGGEDIYPNGMLPIGTGAGGASAGGGSAPFSANPTIIVHVHTYMDGQELAQTSLTQHVATQIVQQSWASGPVGRAA